MDFSHDIYLDHAAATPLDARVRDAMAPYETDAFFNPSAPYAPAWDVRHAYEAARADLAHAFGAKPAEVVVTAGATESINLAFTVCDQPLSARAASSDAPATPLAPAASPESSAASPEVPAVSPESSAASPDADAALSEASAASPESSAASPDTHAASLAPDLLASGHVVTTAIEHSSVLACAQARPHTLVEVNHHGLVDPEAVRAAIKPTTRLVSIGLANNEIGTIQPLRAISDVVRDVRQQRLLAGDATPLYLHSDASQCAGQIDVNVSTLGVDMLTLNAAKIYGPKQVGLLWVARDVQLSPIVLGGGQERGLRSGTENVAGTIGFACALAQAVGSRKEEAVRLTALRDSLQRHLTRAFPDAVVSGHKRRRLPSLLHISFPGLDAERLVYLLEAEGVYVATGAACAANKATRSHVLEAIGLPPEVADGSLRLTLGRLSTEENTQRAAEIITEVVRAEYDRVTAQRSTDFNPDGTAATHHGTLAFIDVESAVSSPDHAQAEEPPTKAAE